MRVAENFDVRATSLDRLWRRTMASEASMLNVALLTLALLVALLLAFRFLLRPWFVGLFFVAGLGAMIANAGRLDLQAFTWIKVITLAVTMAVLLAYPRGGPRARRVLGWAVTGIVFLNILEAVVVDAVAGQWVNATAGALLLVTLAGPSRVGARDLQGRPALTYDLPWSWIAAYTLWNITVVSRHYPQHYFDHVAVLAAPIVAAWLAGDRRLYIEARGLTLSLYAVAIVVMTEVIQAPWIPSAPSPAGFYPLLAGGAAAAGAWNLVAWLRERGTSARK